MRKKRKAPFEKGSVPNAKYERNREIYAMHISGMEDALIGRKFGVSRQRIHSIIKDAKLTPRRDMIHGTQEYIAQLASAGMTTAEIVKQTSLSKTYVLNVINRYGLVTNRWPREMKQKMDELLKLAIEQGVPITELTKGDPSMRERMYRYVRSLGLALPHWTARARVRKQTIKRIAADD